MAILEVSKTAKKGGASGKKSSERLELGSRDREVTEAQSRRGIPLEIQKNKGLQRGRRQRNNQRVKNRNRFAKKLVKLKSMKSIYSGGESRGGYGGELTGIKTHVIRSIKL